MKNTSYSNLHTYQLWNHILLSDLDLGLSAAPPEVSSLTAIHLRRMTQDRMRKAVRNECLSCTNEDGSIWLTISRSGNAFILDFPSLCSFRNDPDVRLIEYAPEPGVAISTIVHLLLDHALPRLMSMMAEYFVLHAGAWVIRDKAYMVLGQSGAGKSTITSWFGSQGFAIITDDCLVLRRQPNNQGWLALPSYRSVRLWPDSIDAIGIDATTLRELAHYSSKRRTSEVQSTLQFTDSAKQVGGAFVLKPSDSGRLSVEICPINNAFAALSLGVFRMEIASPEINRREFEVLTSLLDEVPFWSISHGNDYTQLAELQQRIITLVS